MYVLDISASPPISLHAPSFSPSHSSSSLASSSHNSNSSAGGDHDITTVVIDTVSIALYLTMGLVTAWRLLVHIKDHYTNSTRSGPPQSQSPSPPPSPSPSPSPSRSTAMVEGSSFSHNGTGNSAEYDNSYYAAPNQKKLESASRKKRRKDCLCACCRACDSRLVQFHWFLFSFFMVTIVYWLLSILIHQAVEATRFNVGFKYALGTLSHCLFFTAVLLMLVHMLEHMYAQSTIAIPYVILWVSISVPYTYTLLTTLYFIVNPDQYKDGSPQFLETQLILTRR
ncbi:hypothetical protein Pelo_9808 [Pelomyxa schiedti]|nr:hypothetical protein Pelo_9808 [Pelomyxa schiedti]